MGKLAWVAVACLLTGCDRQAQISATRTDLCEQGAEAAHYIAAKASDSDHAAQITRDLIAERKYPDLGDKLVAGAGMVAILGLNAGMTPDQIHDSMLAKCTQEAAQR